jgi:uncharacterized protein
LDSLYDSNVWVAMTFASHPFHAKAHAEFSTATEVGAACFCRATQTSFLRLISTPSVQAHYGVQNLTNADALQIYARQLASPAVSYLQEPNGTELLWHRLAALKSPSPKVWMDAYLAAFAISGGHRFVTTDKDFRNFVAHGLNLVLLAL